MSADLQLLSRYHQQGDPKAFAELMREHGGMVFATARRITQDTALAEDVAQEVFLTLARQSCERIECLAAWLHRIAWVKAQNLVVSESRRRTRQEAAAEFIHHETEAAWSEIEPAVDEVLAELPEKARTLLIEHFLEQRTQTEIAKRHGMSQATVSRQLESGLNLLRSGLKARGVLCGAGLATLLSSQSLSAAPGTLTASVGKLSMTGIGTSSAASTTLFTTTLVTMTTSTKILLSAVAVAASLSLLVHQIKAPLPKPAVVTKPVAPSPRPQPRTSTPLTDSEVNALIQLMQAEETAFGWQPASQSEAIGLSLGSLHRHILGLTVEPHPDEMSDIQEEGKRAIEKVSRMMHEVTNPQTASDYSAGILSAALNLDAKQAESVRSILHDAYADTYSSGGSPARAYQDLIERSDEVFAKIHRTLGGDQSNALSTLYGAEGRQFFELSLFQPMAEN